MLGGSFQMAFLRNGLGAVLMMSVFLLLDHPRLSMKKTIFSYILFGLLATGGFSVWYLLERASYVRFAGMVCIPIIGAFCILMSGDILYLSLYKLTLGFYLLSVTVVCGIDMSRMWFGGNMWADILVRLIVFLIIEFLIITVVRVRFLAGADELRNEMDLFSAVTVLLSILMAALAAFWPGDRTFSVPRILQIWTILFMAGIIQYIVFHLYMHRGREHRYQTEKELLEINEQLLRRQLELLRKSELEMARIRHDIRHHILLIKEYIRNGETDKLLSYVKQYEEDLGIHKTEYICGNQTVNAILSVYARRAREEGIKVTLQAELAEDIAVRDIDLVAVLANILENAIHGCTMSHASQQEIYVSINRKGKKIVIQCRNTCASDIRFKNGIPQSSMGGGIGVSSIMKVVSYYNGEVNFAVEEGMFIVRILLNCGSIHDPADLCVTGNRNSESEK